MKQTAVILGGLVVVGAIQAWISLIVGVFVLEEVKQAVARRAVR